MLKLIEEFSRSIDLQKSKVKKGTLKLTVFGGPNHDHNGTPKSQRSIFLLRSTHLADAFVVPEDFKNWNHFGVYDDLLTFEEDICSASDSVLIFLESAGSIAEFGFLIKHPQIAQKLHVVIQNSFYQEDSFIRLGLLNHLKNKFDDSKIIVSQNNDLQVEECNHIVQLIKDAFKKNTKEESFKQKIFAIFFHLL